MPAEKKAPWSARSQALPRLFLVRRTARHARPASRGVQNSFAKATDGAPLQHSAMHALNCHVVRHVAEPEPFPLQDHRAEIFRRENQLLRTMSRIS